MMVFIIGLGGISLGLGQNIEKATNYMDKPISFEGRVTSVRTKSKDSRDVSKGIYVYLDMRIVNNSEQKLIFPAKKFDCKTINLKRSNGKSIANLQLPTAAELPKWNEIVRSFDKSKPPESKTTSLAVGSGLSFNTFFKLDVSNYNNNDLLFSQSVSLDDLKENSSIFIEVICTTKPTGLDLYNLKENGDGFWQGLQTRWRKYGYLWIDEIKSEPIPLDLNSFFVK